jgi:hypothetical protein
MLDPEHPVTEESNDELDDPEELADAYEALEEDRRQRAKLISTDPSTVADPPKDVGTADRAETESSPDAAVLPLETQAIEPAACEPARRVFLIDGKEYPDPDVSLPITGARSVQSMYRDYFPGQLDNADVLQKTRADGTLEVTFRRRIGTKGRASQSNARGQRPKSSGEVVLDVSRIVSVLARISEDRPMAWRLVEQALGPNGELRLDYVPPASDLNLAEAQVSARTRLIDFAVDELVGLRASL